MNSLEKEVRPLLVEDVFYESAIALIKADPTPIRDTIGRFQQVPFCEMLQESEQHSVLERIQEVNKIQGLVNSFVAEVMKDNPQQKRLAVVDSLVLNDWVPERLGAPKREYQISVVNAALRVHAAEYAEAPEEEKIDRLQPLLYLSFLHEFLVGARTSVTFYLDHKEELGPDFLDKERILLFSDGPDDLRRRAVEMSFNGKSVSTIKSAGGNDFVTFG